MATRQRRIALVTGANKGIGFETARQLAREGFRVFIGARDEKAGEAAAEKLRAEGARTKDKSDDEIEFLKIDITNIDSIRSAAEEFSRSTDRLDVLINNAGILLDDDKDILTTTPEIFENTLRTNTLGALLVSQAFVPFLKNSDAPADRECVQRRRPIDRRRRRLGAGLLHFQNRDQRRHRSARR